MNDKSKHHSNASHRLASLAEARSSTDEIDASESLNQWIDRMHDGGLVPRDESQTLSNSESVDRIATLATQLWELGNHVASGTEITRAEPTEFPTIEGYQIHRIIGRGGMGIVYSGTEVALNRDVAIKVLGGNIGSSAKARRRFQLEVQAAAQLEHPNIVPIYRYGEYSGGLFFTMREIDGVDLSVKLCDQASATFGPAVEMRSREYRQWVATIGMQIAEALAHSHEQLVVHRDVKPANVLIDRKGNAYLSDFGLARLSEGSSLTGEQDLLGTVLYMSPEQVSGKAAVGGSSDIYSLGATLYELLTLQPMISETSCGAALKRISDGRIPSPSSSNPTLETDLETIVLKAIAPEPVSRYLSAQAMADDLRLFLEMKPIRATRATIPMRFSRWVRRNSRWVAGLSAVAGLCLIAILGLAIDSANRSAVDSATIRQQATQLLDERGTELLTRDDVRAAEANFQQVVELTRDPIEKRKQQQRLASIDAWAARLLNRTAFDGRLLAHLPESRLVLTRKHGPSEVCTVTQADGTEVKLFETTRDIQFATASPDGEKIAIVVGDLTNRNPELKLYDAKKQHLRTLPTDDWRLTEVWFLAGSDQLLSTGWGGTLSLYDLQEASSSSDSVRIVALPQVDKNISWVYSADLSRDKSRLVCSINPGRLVAYSLPEMKPLWDEPIDLNDWSVNTIAISDHGHWVATGTDPQGIRLWHATSGREIQLDNNVAGAATDVEFSSDEQTLVAGDNRGGVYVWKLPRLESDTDDMPLSISRRGLVMRHERAIQSLRFNGRDELLVSTGEYVQAWRLDDNQPITTKISVGDSLTSANWDDDRITFLTHAADGVVQWRWQLPSSLQAFQQGSGNLSTIHSGSSGTRIAVYDRKQRSEAIAIRTSDDPTALAEVLLPSSGGNQAVPVAIDEQRMAYLSVAGNEEKRQYRIHIVDRKAATEDAPPAVLDSWINDLAFNTAETKWIANDFSDRIFVGNVRSGQVEQTLSHPNWVEDAKFVGDDQFASICWDQRLRIWDARGSETHQFELDARPSKLCVGVRFFVVAAGEHLYGFRQPASDASWNQIFHTQHAGEAIQKLAISPTRASWLSCGTSGSNRLWTISGQLISEFSGEGPLLECCFSPDGQWLATLNEVGNIHIRNATTGEIMAPTLRGRSAIQTMNWSQDGLLFGGNHTESYWLSRVRLPENWSSNSKQSIAPQEP